jgi:biopolymer transport protein ExbD
MRSFVIAISFTGMFLAGCKREPATTVPPSQTQEKSAEANTVVKITLASDGQVTANGQIVTLDQLGAKLADVKQDGGEVWYYRENPASEPHPNALKVMDLVAQNGLPIKLSAKPDFSDSVDATGISHPGK